MARVKFGTIVTDIRGSIGGFTFQGSAYGSVLKSKFIPLKYITPAQSLVKSRLFYLQSCWRNLSDSDRLKWNNFISFSNTTTKNNKSVLINGYNLFIKYQSARLIAGYDILSTFNFSVLDFLPPNFYITRSGSNFYLTFSNEFDTDSYFFNIFLSYQVPDNVKFRNVGLKFISLDSYSYPNAYFQSSYSNIFGSLPSVASSVYFRIYWFSLIAPIISYYQKGVKVVQ